MNSWSLGKSLICAKFGSRLCDSFSTTANLTDDPGEFMVIVGVNHAKVGSSVYSALAINSLNRLMGIGGPSDVDYDGSAQYFMGDEDIAQFLYAYTIARDCSDKGTFCFEVPSSGDLSIDPKNDALLIIERVYLNPKTLLGMYTPEIINPIMVHYSPMRSNSVTNYLKNMVQDTLMYFLM